MRREAHATPVRSARSAPEAHAETVTAPPDEWTFAFERVEFVPDEPVAAPVAFDELGAEVTIADLVECELLEAGDADLLAELLAGAES